VHSSALREETEVKTKDFGPKVEGNFLNFTYEREHIYIYIYMFGLLCHKKFYKNKDMLHKF